MEHIPTQDREIPLQTIRGLWVVLSELIEAGHGNTAVALFNDETGINGIGRLELCDTTEEVEQGLLPAPLTFFIV